MNQVGIHNPDQGIQSIVPPIEIARFSDPEFLPTRQQIGGAFVDPHNPEYFNKVWSNLCLRDGQDPVPGFEFLTVEYINELTGYLVYKGQRISAEQRRPANVLEICAGNGRLTHFLQARSNVTTPGTINVTATDNGIRSITPTFPVINNDYKEALQRYKPDIVLCSWMPMKEDFSRDIRACNSVREYILIGERDLCGDPWLTWGEVPEQYYYYNESEARDTSGLESWEIAMIDYIRNRHVPPFTRDGFVETRLERVEANQLCAFDRPGAPSYSSTISFCRQKRNTSLIYHYLEIRIN